MHNFSIIGCPAWGAAPPRHGFESIIWTPGPAEEILFHHTAGHHPEVENPKNESRLEAFRYVQALQRAHQSPSSTDSSKPWNDTGQSFTICRNGLIFQGRWRTIRAIRAKRMVISAHCPGKNDQIGIEHEHFGHEEMTPIQREASAWLQSWIALQYGHSNVLPVYPHKKFFSTECPANLVKDIPRIRTRAQQMLDAARGI